MSFKTVRKLERGDPVRRNWRTINETIENLARHDSLLNANAAAAAELRRRPKDLTGGSSVKRMQILQRYDNYLTCYPWDENANDWSTEAVAVAKQPKSRNVASEVIGGVTVSYSYTTPTRRTASATGVENETQDLRFAVGDEIYAADTGERTGVTRSDATDPDNDDSEINWIDLTNRIWESVAVVPIP